LILITGGVKMIARHIFKSPEPVFEKEPRKSRTNLPFFTRSKRAKPALQRAESGDFIKESNDVASPSLIFWWLPVCCGLPTRPGRSLARRKTKINHLEWQPRCKSAAASKGVFYEQDSS